MPLTVQDLLGAAVDTTELPTKIIPVPEGQYTATILKYDTKICPPKEADKPPACLIKMLYGIADPDVATECQRDNPVCEQAIFLNVNAAGNLDSNNLGLGRFLEAAEAKELGEVSLQEALDSALGMTVVVTVTHREFEGETYAQVKKVEHISKLDD
jgi:hypothetical protein